MAITFENMNLDEKVLQAIVKEQFKTPTEIQQKVIPLINQGKDLIASAQTGSGKTLAFVLPAIQRVIHPCSSMEKTEEKEGKTDKPALGPKVLILTPTRELAQQVTTVIHKMAKFTRIKYGSITGGVPYFAQENLLRKPLDILVATPGRLMDHMSKNRVNYSRLELLILDEADRMLDMGFIKDIEKIMSAIHHQHQILLFSATLEGEVQKIANRFLKDPLRIQLTHAKNPNTAITQRIHQADDYRHKQALLMHLLGETNIYQAIVFTGTKRSADELADDLAANNIACAPLHGDMKQSKRSRTLERMHKGQLRVLVATDVAARGIDVKNISHVINFDLPRTGEAYIHRIGRTGRANESGTAISLVGPNDWPLLSNIERFTGQKLERGLIDGLEPKNKEPGKIREFRRSGSHSTHSKKNNKNKAKKPFRSERNFSKTKQNHSRSENSYSNSNSNSNKNNSKKDPRKQRNKNQKFYNTQKVRPRAKAISN